MIFTNVAISLAAAVLTWICYRLLRSHRQHQDDLRWAASQGCLPPRVLDSGPWPLGLQLIFKAFKTANEQKLLHLFVDIVRTNGKTFEQRLLGTSGIDTVDPVNLEALLSKQFTDFGLGERRLVFFPLLGDGIFTQDGRAWEHSRALLRPTFQHNRERIFAEVAAATETVMNLMHEGYEIDLQPLFFRFTLETTCFLLFGRSLSVLSEGVASTASSFADAFDEAQDFLARRGRLGGLYWLIDGFRFRKQCKIVHRYIDAAVDLALASRDAKEEQPVYTLLDGLLQETDDRRVLREQCLNVLLAGRDTTACLLSWTFRLLVSHPRVLDLLKSEIAEICGTNPTPTRAQLKLLRYLDAVLKEVLRLYPSVPINARTATRRTTLPTGGGPHRTAPILIKQGTSVGYCPYAMHRDPAIFGPDALEFRPERWIENEGKLFQEAGYAYVPFNAGPRMCLGQEFAIHEAGYMVVRMLQNWPGMYLAEVEKPVERVGEERQRVTLVVCCAEGCRVVLQR